MDYLKFLEHSFEVENEVSECRPNSRLEYLADHIFNFTTYDSEMSELFAGKAVEVCAAITDGKTFEYIEDHENYKWYLLMCNMPFFSEKLEWGSSIRGAWWNQKITFQSLGLWKGDEQVTEVMDFSETEWKLFVDSILEFAGQGQ